jgi:hypothetical protein
MSKVAHIYARNAKMNSGDYMIGIAYKKYFEEVILKKKCVFYDIDCRDSKSFNDENINKLNSYDYIILGGGGLILPDSQPNKISCWQWVISKENINKIRVPIFVLSIGYNLFFEQKITMHNRENSVEDKSRMNIFKDNIITLINKSTKFTLRHKDDVNKLINIVGDEYKKKINYEICATVWYVNKYWKPNINNIDRNKKFFAIEIKDDREWRRYYKIGKSKYYSYLLNNIVKKHINNNDKILYLSHDGSKNFYNYLKKNNITIPFLDNSCGNESKIRDNYSKIHTIYCSAGHSQMISYGLGIKIISLVTHPKIKNFCDDIMNKDFIDVNNIITT